MPSIEVHSQHEMRSLISIDSLLSEDELVTGVERLKGTAKGIDLAAFIMEHRSLAPLSPLQEIQKRASSV